MSISGCCRALWANSLLARRTARAAAVLAPGEGDFRIGRFLDRDIFHLLYLSVLVKIS